MKRFASLFLILVCVLCVSPLGAAGKKEASDTAVPPAEKQETADKNTAETISPTADGNAAVSTQAEEISSKDIPAGATEPEDIPAEKMSADTIPAAEVSAEAAKNGEPADLTFASIHSKGLTVADGNKWYYENFDRRGRASFAVLYEDTTAVEKTVWTYKDSGRYPAQKKIFRTTGLEIFRYDEEGKELSIERYEGKTLTSKTENVYNSFGKLMEQTISAGKNTDRSVWEFAGDKAVTQTKYRNGKKTAFIELHSTPHIVHLYVDDKEVYVGEEQ